MSTPSPFTFTKHGLSYRVELDVHYISDEEMQMLRRYITTLNDENAKLRKLVRDMFYAVHPVDREKFLTNMAELGVEP